jgi:spoIIIJ-associated protein
MSEALFPGEQLTREFFDMLLAATDTVATVSIDEDAQALRVSVVVEADGAGRLIGRHGQTIDAIEYLLNRFAFSKGYGEWRISVDIDGYRERRASDLAVRAREAADRVSESGRPLTFSGLNARDRRTVHAALQSDGRVETISEGEDPDRILIVRPRGAGASRA